MAKTGQNILMYQGDEKVLVVTVRDEKTNAILDINGVDLTWVVYRKTYPYNVILTKTIGNGITLTDPDNGQFEIEILPANTSGIYGDFNHECELVDVNGYPSTIFTGYFKIYFSRAGSN